MRILDINLDFFLNKTPYNRPLYSNKRLSGREYKPWNAVDVCNFLESRCGISKPVKGRVLKHHDEAFFFWKELISNDLLELPFDVVHSDSHADIGYGDLGCSYLMSELLHQPTERRQTPDCAFNAMNTGNYLDFTIACHWIKSLTYVNHDNIPRDLLPIYFKDFSIYSGYIELNKLDRDIFDEICSGRRIHDTYESWRVIGTEPPVPFYHVNLEDFINDKPFNFIVLAQSPSFTPIKSDDLIPVICKYIDCV